MKDRMPSLINTCILVLAVLIVFLTSDEILFDYYDSYSTVSIGEAIDNPHADESIFPALVPAYSSFFINLINRIRGYSSRLLHLLFLFVLASCRQNRFHVLFDSNEFTVCCSKKKRNNSVIALSLGGRAPPVVVL